MFSWPSQAENPGVDLVILKLGISRKNLQVKKRNHWQWEERTGETKMKVSHLEEYSTLELSASEAHLRVIPLVSQVNLYNSARLEHQVTAQTPSPCEHNELLTECSRRLLGRGKLRRLCGCHPAKCCGTL
ncbi:hypothetical protein NDU88_006093 [Pleurodeles waltl]|uniref:Uncharacterized protein n=1 Tax=Pleurodeles waltl TaxID=8319 RepID=A0AAV7UM07_PLEWA|nr:hypothetical protein NDU88_006093 [Pleurodeles waltl]